MDGVEKEPVPIVIIPSTTHRHRRVELKKKTMELNADRKKIIEKLLADFLEEFPSQNKRVSAWSVDLNVGLCCGPYSPNKGTEESHSIKNCAQFTTTLLGFLLTI